MRPLSLRFVWIAGMILSAYMLHAAVMQRDGLLAGVFGVAITLSVLNLVEGLSDE